LEQELYANAKAIPSDLGGGLQGHIGLLMPNADYLALAPNMVGYITPVCPDLPNYAGTTAIQRTELQDAYKKALDSFTEARAVSNYLMHLIIAAVPPTYLKKIQHRKLGYANTTPQQMLAHLVNTYSVITSADIQANLSRLHAPWAPDTPIENVFNNGDDCRAFAEDRDDPISDAAYVRALIEIFRNSGVFPTEVKEFDLRPLAERTVDNTIQYFTKLNAYRRSHQPTIKGILTANAAITNDAEGPNHLKGFYYCWSHGICDHTSETCTQQATGHIKAATAHNLCGGCTFMQRPNDYKAVFKYVPATRDPAKDARNKNSKRKRPQQPKQKHWQKHSP
ncbi:MAG: hypothetical protein ACRCT2_06670, partial [Plesiomonas shigelloides]